MAPAIETETLPTGPGVYLFKDAKGEPIYVGKAVNLRSRVRQYLQGADERPTVAFLGRLRKYKGVDFLLEAFAFGFVCLLLSNGAPFSCAWRCGVSDGRPLGIASNDLIAPWIVPRSPGWIGR